MQAAERRGIPRVFSTSFEVRWIACAGALVLAGCGGPQSALDPAGRGAETIARLFWWMAAGGAAVWLAVAGLAVYAFHVQPGPHQKQNALLIIGGGAVVPTLVLAVLLSFGLAEMPRLLAPAPEGSLQIAVTGEQWWWRVRYLPPGRAPVELANEIRLPVGEPVRVSSWRAPTSSTPSGSPPSAARWT